MIRTIDGSQGEGGGQVLRTALSLSLVTGMPFQMVRIRARRRRPGLRRQHLTAVRAASTVGAAAVSGATLDSTEIEFHPGAVSGGAYHFSIGTSGSTTLVLQTLLPALLGATAPSRVTLEGGTHNPLAPTFDFMVHAFLPLLRRMGADVELTLERPGFHPTGGGRLGATVEPGGTWQPLELTDRGGLRATRARALVAGLAKEIGRRELRTVGTLLGWPAEALRLEVLDPALGPGNVLVLEVESTECTEVFTGFGRRGVPAERVATEAARETAEYLAAPVPVGRHLADQLLIPMSLAGGGRFRTLSPTRHLRTQAALIPTFLPVRIELQALDSGVWEVIVATR